MNRFLEAGYKPTETEVVVHYTVLPLRKDSFHECLHEVVQSLQFSGREDRNQLRVFDLNQEHFQCKIAFPEELFEPHNLPQNLSVLSGSIFDQISTASIKIHHISWSKKLLKTFPGPSKGIQKIREELNIPERPLSCGMLLPKSPLPIKEYLEKAYLMWMGGCDLVEENEIMVSPSIHEYQERIEYLSKEMKNCSDRTKKRKEYIPNITTGKSAELEARAIIAKNAGIKTVAINSIQMGWSGVSSALKICHELNLNLIAHQAGIGLYTQNEHFGWSPAALASLHRLMGLEMLHIDSGMRESIPEIDTLTKHEESIEQTFPIYSGDIHPGDIGGILKKHGYDLVIQAGKYLENHPDGIKAGTEAFQYAIEIATQGIELDSAIKKNEPLRRAMESWNRLDRVH